MYSYLRTLSRHVSLPIYFRTGECVTSNLCMVSPTGLIRDAFTHFGSPEAGDDPRFADVYKLTENAGAASDLIVKAIGAKPFSYWRQHLKTMKGDRKSVV